MKRFQFLSTRIACCFAVCIAELLVIAAAAAFGVSPGLLSVFAAVSAAIDAFCIYFWVLYPYFDVKKVLRKVLAREYPDQIFKLFTGFSPEENRVFQSLEHMIDRTGMIRMEIRESELLALQNQINPHFLYNTLEAIRSDALMYGADDVAAITESLATYFRYTISALDRTVPLSEELHNIEDYFNIQRYRFGDELKISINYSENWLMAETLYIPKMTLQPLVENAIFHGIEPCENLGSINIWIDRTPNVLLVCVEDNGVGMDEEQVKHLNASLDETFDEHAPGIRKRKHGIALRNVHHRIQLLFGKEYGLHVMSALGFGTEAWLTFPVCTEARQYEM